MQNKQECLTEPNQVAYTQRRNWSNAGKSLHEDLIQLLYAARLYVNLAKNDEVHSKMYLEESSEHIRSVIDEMRNVSLGVTNGENHVSDLFENIRTLLDDYSTMYSIKIELHEEKTSDEDVSEELQLDIFSIVQIQLNNIIKHSTATEVFVNLTEEANKIILFIADNGKDGNTAERKKEIGITSIISKAELYHGKVRITARPGKGYELEVVLSTKDLVQVLR
jgi:two-component system sensor histidine kinase UhpB